MKIGIFTNNYLPNPYGVTASIESFRKEFEALGHEVFIFAPEWKGYEDKDRHVFRYPSIDIKIKFRFPLAMPYSRKMDKVLKDLDLDIIHSQHPNLLGTAASKWAKRKNIPLVFTWHTLYDQYTNFVPFLPKKMAGRWIIKKAVKYADACDHVIVPTGSVQPIVEKWGVKNKNIDAIATGVDEENFQNPNRDAVRKKYGVADDETLLVLISRLTEEKNIEFLFGAVAPILKKNKKVKFLAAGGGYLVPKLKEMARMDGVDKQIIFAGIVERTELKNHFCAGDIFVYASKSETQGMALSEAMYCGLPIVAVKASGIESLVENGANGILVSESKEEFGRAIARLIADESLRQGFSEESKRIAREKYTAAVCAKKMLEVYEKAIKSRSRQQMG